MTDLEPKTEIISKETVPPPVVKPKAIIIDIDGTLMDNSKRASLGVPFVKYENDIAMLHTDKQIESMVTLINVYCRVTNSKPVFLTGRMDNFDGKVREITLQQITTALPNLEFDLIMREEDDFSKALEYKYNAIRKIRLTYDTIMLLDDDRQVCEFVAERFNILCLQPYWVEKQVKS